MKNEQIDSFRLQVDIRDYFAGCALPPLIILADRSEDDAKRMTDVAYQIADKMLKSRQL